MTQNMELSMTEEWEAREDEQQAARHKRELLRLKEVEQITKLSSQFMNTEIDMTEEWEEAREDEQQAARHKRELLRLKEVEIKS